MDIDQHQAVDIDQHQLVDIDQHQAVDIDQHQAVDTGRQVGRHVRLVPPVFVETQKPPPPLGEHPVPVPYPLRVALVVLAVLFLPVVLPISPLLVLAFRARPMWRWFKAWRADPGPHTFWGRPDAAKIRKLLEKHGCYYTHGALGSGKSQGGVLLGLVLAWEQVDRLTAAGDTETQVYLFFNYTVYDYKARMFLLLLGCPIATVKRVTVEQFSIMDLSEATHQHVWRRRHSVIVCDELPYYMEEDKKTVRSVLLRKLRMARRRQQFVVAIGQEIIHSRYRPLFHLRGECRMMFGRMTITWRGAQDVVDSRKPTKPVGRIAYGLDVRRLAACYDTWEDLEDLDDDESGPMLTTPRRVA